MRKALIKPMHVYVRESRSKDRYTRERASYPICVLGIGRYTLVSEPCGRIAVEVPEAVHEDRIVALIPRWASLSRPAQKITPDTEWVLELFTPGQIAKTWEEHAIQRHEEEMLRAELSVADEKLTEATNGLKAVMTELMRKLPESVRSKSRPLGHGLSVVMDAKCLAYLFSHEIKGVEGLLDRLAKAEVAVDAAFQERQRVATCVTKATGERYV